MPGICAPLAQRCASFFAASAASRSCFTRGPCLDSSVAPEFRNSTQFSKRSLARAKTTRLNCSGEIPSAWAAVQNAALSFSGLCMLSSTSAQTTTVVSPPDCSAALISFGNLAITVDRPPQSTVRITLLPGQGRIHEGLSLLISARMNSGSMLRPFLPSCKQTIWVRLGTHPSPCYRFAGIHSFGNIQRPNACRRRVVVPPQITAVLLPSAAENLRMMRD